MSFSPSYTLAVPVASSPGATMSLSSVLNQAMGATYKDYSGFWLWYADDAYLKSLYNPPFSYWNPSSPSVAQWTVNGQAIPAQKSYYVSAADIGSVNLISGNEIYAGAQVQCIGPNSTYAWYRIEDIASSLKATTAGVSPPTAGDIVTTAKAFAAAYTGVANGNDCHNMAHAVAAAAGAALPIDSGDGQKPANNVDGGFWNVVYRGTSNPVADWSTLLQPGDIVRMAWTTNGSEHTTVVTGARQTDGTFQVFDNVDWTHTDANGQAYAAMGLTQVSYQKDTIASSITIYRLSTANQYLINGDNQDEYLGGTVFNDRFVVGTGKNTINGGDGTDTAVFSGASTAYTVTSSGGHLLVSAGGITDTLDNVEYLQFSDKTVATSGAMPSVTGDAVYRFFNAKNGTHFFTSSAAERDLVKASIPDFKYEGALFDTVNANYPGATPVYRFNRPDNGTHFYTISASEKDGLIKNSPEYSYEGVAYYAFTADNTTAAGLSGVTPLYRFYRAGNGSHFFTTSADERDGLIKNMPDTYKYEGIAYYVTTPPAAAPADFQASAAPADLQAGVTQALTGAAGASGLWASDLAATGGGGANLTNLPAGASNDAQSSITGWALAGVANLSLSPAADRLLAAAGLAGIGV